MDIILAQNIVMPETCGLICIKKKMGWDSQFCGRHDGVILLQDKVSQLFLNVISCVV